VVLIDRDGFEQSLTVPPIDASLAQWQELFEGARLRAERALARPVTHAVVVLPATPADAAADNIAKAAEEAGLLVSLLAAPTDLAAAVSPALAAAMLAEDLMPRPEGESR
jgi:molecular chaperone DnaK (HSP70)